MNFSHAILIIVVLLGASHLRAEGKYQRTRGGGALIWNNYPSPEDVATWEGGVDAEGYASGQGLLTWWKGSVWKSRYEGKMVQGRLEGLIVNEDADGTFFTGTFLKGQKGADWERWQGLSKPDLEQLQKSAEADSGSDSPQAGHRGEKAVLEMPGGPVPPGKRMVLPSAVEVPAFLKTRPWHYLYIIARTAEKGPIRGGNGGGQLDFFTEITEPEGVCFGTIMLCTASLPGAWEQSLNVGGNCAYAKYRFIDGVTRNDVVRLEAYWRRDGSIDYTLPMRVMYCENRQKYYFEGYCTAQGPNGRGTVSGKDVALSSVEGRTYGIFKDGTLIKPCTLAEFASPETLAHLERNQRLAGAQKMVLGVLAAGTVITFGTYDAVGRKMQKWQAEAGASGNTKSSSSGHATPPSSSRTSQSAAQQSQTRTFIVKSDARRAESTGQITHRGRNTITIAADGERYSVEYGFDYPYSYLVTGGGDLTGKAVTVHFKGGTAAQISCSAGNGRCEITRFGRE